MTCRVSPISPSLIVSVSTVVTLQALVWPLSLFPLSSPPTTWCLSAGRSTTCFIRLNRHFPGRHATAPWTLTQTAPVVSYAETAPTVTRLPASSSLSEKSTFISPTIWSVSAFNFPNVRLFYLTLDSYHSLTCYLIAHELVLFFDSFQNFFPSTATSFSIKPKALKMQVAFAGSSAATSPSPGSLYTFAYLKESNPLAR